MLNKVVWRGRVTDCPAAPISIPNLIWQTLYGRGLTDSSSVESCLKPSLKNLRSPFLLKNMDVAVARMVEAFRREEPICVYADFDLDGSSGLALLKTGLEGLGFKNVIGYQPKRLSEGYGVHSAAIKEIAQTGAKVLVTVDVGITAAGPLKEAQDLGMDVILTDHHLPHGELPQVLALINPNQGTCESGLGHLAGVGVAFYFFLATRSALREAGIGHTDFDPKELLDFFVIGTLTDMVPLREENRILAKHGLWQLANTKRPGLRALLDILDLGERDLTSQDVAIRFAPKLNALSRLESSLRPIDMFLAQDADEAGLRAREVLECNQRRVSIQKDAERIARESVQSAELGACIWVWSDQFHRGVIGLVATRLAQEFKRPALVGALDFEGRIVGSARLPGKGGQSLVSALEFAKAHLERFGGHAQAAGFELKCENAEGFAASLNEYFAQQEPSSEICEYYDAEGDLSEVNPEFMRWHEGLGPFGVEFELPRYRLTNTKIRRLTELKGGHLKLELESVKTGSRHQAIWFSPPEGAANLAKVAGEELYEVLAEPSWNYFQGNKSLQLQLKGLKAFNP